MQITTKPAVRTCGPYGGFPDTTLFEMIFKSFVGSFRSATGITNRSYLVLKVKVRVVIIAICDIAANSLHRFTPKPFKKDEVNITHRKIRVNGIFIQKMTKITAWGQSQR